MSRQRVRPLLTADELLVGYGLKKIRKKAADKSMPRTTAVGQSSVIYVRLKGRKADSGNVILYLEYYAHGVLQRYYPGLKLEPETMEGIRLRNDETMRKARDLAREQNERAALDPLAFRLDSSKDKRMPLYDYIVRMADEKGRQQGTLRSSAYTLLALAKHIQAHDRRNGYSIRLCDVDADYIGSFVEYMKQAPNNNYQQPKSRKRRTKQPPTLSENTRYNNYKRLQSVINDAVKKKLIRDNPFDVYDGEKPRGDTATREYLTLEEVERLVDTPCRNDTLKRAFLFCCFTGLRFSDVSRITGANISETQGRTLLTFKTEKTDKVQYVFLPAVAVQCLPDRYGKETALFPLGSNDHTNQLLAQWVREAGISKRITFHCSRHTSATLSLSNGTPLAVVSRFLGHSMVSTTQVYAKIVDTALIDLADKQDELFNGINIRKP